MRGDDPAAIVQSLDTKLFGLHRVGIEDKYFERRGEGWINEFRIKFFANPAKFLNGCRSTRPLGSARDGEERECSAEEPVGRFPFCSLLSWS